MPPVTRAVRRTTDHDSGQIVKSLRAARDISPFLDALSFLSILCLAWASGCASRRPAADRTQPPPIAPSAAPENEGEAGKNPSNAEPSKPPAAAPKRNKPAASPAPEGYVEEGNASWYGEPFHGRRASNGEIYDMYKLTAAHRTLPFDTIVRVTNLTNGKSTNVRITDRGPFVENRVIDLSMAAAREIESIGPGVVPVRIEIVSGSVDLASGFFTVQVGAFRDRGNAERLRDRLNATYNPVFVQQYDSPEGLYYRVRVGKVSSEDAARQFGEQLRAREGFTPFVVRLDEGAGAGGN
jgi:rare lipoprotein A